MDPDVSEADEALLSYVRALRGSREAPDQAALREHHPALAEALDELARLKPRPRANDAKIRYPIESNPQEPWRCLRGGQTCCGLGEILASSVDDERYSTLYEIRRGGMGIVYAVWDRRIMRRIAMKVSHEPIPGGSGECVHDSRDRRVARFAQEMRILSQLAHPSIVPLYDLGIDTKGYLFFTMPLIRGDILDVVIGRCRDQVGGWTIVRALQVMVRVCEALIHAHSKGVVHMDLKPANVMVGDSGQTYLLDWGLAEVLERDDGLDEEKSASTWCLESVRYGSGTDDTPFEYIAGTPAYMSPERAQGISAGRRSDVYAFGAMLYHLLSGSPPYAFDVEDPNPHSVHRALLHGPPKSLVEIDRRIPGELVEICEVCMHRSADLRYQTMREVGDALGGYLERCIIAKYGKNSPRWRRWLDHMAKRLH